MLANPPLARPRAFSVRPKYLLFAFIGVMTVYVLGHNERFLIEPENPAWKHYAPIRWWLYPHAIAGTFTMLVAPLQFSDRLRRRFTKLHRVSGRIYVAGVLALAPLGAYTQYVDQLNGEGSRGFTVLAVVDAVMLIAPTLIALSFAMKRNITLHRQWMTRSYAVALVFFEGRFIAGITGWERDPVMTEAVVWACLAFSILLGDLAVQWQERRIAAR